MSSYQMDTQDWKDHNKDVQARKARRRDELSNMVENFCLTHRILLEKITPYQFRLIQSGFISVDIFMTSSKIRLLKKGEKFKTVDLYKWLKKYYNVVKDEKGI